MLSTGAARIIVGSLFALGAVYHREASTGISHFWLVSHIGRSTDSLTCVARVDATHFKNLYGA